MTYMLDTNACIHAIKRKGNVLPRILSHEADEICISSITYAELCCGVEKSHSPDRNRLALHLFLSEIAILNYDDSAAEEYGLIRASLEHRGTPIGPMDLLIASHARSLGAVLVTNNTREFSRVNALTIEDWL